MLSVMMACGSLREVNDDELRLPSFCEINKIKAPVRVPVRRSQSPALRPQSPVRRPLGESQILNTSQQGVASWFDDVESGSGKKPLMLPSAAFCKQTKLEPEDVIPLSSSSSTGARTPQCANELRRSLSSDEAAPAAWWSHSLKTFKRNAPHALGTTPRTSPMAIPGHVWFNMRMNTYTDITPYATIYGVHPRFFNFDRDGYMQPNDTPSSSGPNVFPPGSSPRAISPQPMIALHRHGTPHAFHAPAASMMSVPGSMSPMHQHGFGFAVNNALPSPRAYPAAFVSPCAVGSPYAVNNLHRTSCGYPVQGSGMCSNAALLGRPPMMHGAAASMSMGPSSVPMYGRVGVHMVC